MIINKRMDGRVALVTGGGTGIGAAIAQLFAVEGAQVCIMGRRREPLVRTVELLTKQGLSSVYCTGDVSQSGDVENAMEFTIEKFGIVDCLVNNAGIVSRVDDGRTTQSDKVSEIMNINMGGTFTTTRIFLNKLLEDRREGTIVNISSTVAHQVPIGYVSYATSKAAIIAFSRAIAVQFASYNIRCNCVSPGVVHTPMAYVDNPNFDEQIGSLNSLHPLGRIGKPEDIASAVLFLSSSESAWITGQELVVDGGLSVVG